MKLSAHQIVIVTPDKDKIFTKARERYIRRARKLFYKLIREGLFINNTT